MFFLKDLPTNMSMREFLQRFPDMNPSALRTCTELMRIGSDLLTVFEKILGYHGLSQGRFLTLMVVNRTPDQPVSPSYLADKLCVKRATMTGLVDGLEKSGLIERLSHPEDGRRTTIRITRRGREVLEDVMPDYYGNMAKVTANLMERDRQELASHLKKIQQGLSAVSTNPTP